MYRATAQVASIRYVFAVPRLTVTVVVRAFRVRTTRQTFSFFRTVVCTYCYNLLYRICIVLYIKMYRGVVCAVRILYIL